MREREERARPLARRLRGTMTNAEVILWSRLRRGGLHVHRFRRQHPIGPYVADFACVGAKLVVEVDGETHSTAEQLAHDARRRLYFAQRGWREVRVGNNDVYKRINEVLELIWREASLGPVR